MMTPLSSIRIRRVLALVIATMLAWACGSNSPKSGPSSTGTGSTDANAGSGGMASIAPPGGVGGASGGAGAGGTSGAGSPAPGAGGTTSAANGGSGGSVPDAGLQDAGPTPMALLAAAKVLDGFAILKPCGNGFKPSGNANNAGDCCCDQTPDTENQHVTKQFGGDPNIIYNVKVRIAGVAERYWYTGGMLDAASQLFYSGGLPTIHSTSAPNNNLAPGQGACKIHPPETDGQYKLPFTVPSEVRPADGCYNGFNTFAMTVSSPKKSYYLNYTTDFDNNDRQPHSVYKTDYTVVVPISGQAQLDFYTIDGDHHQVTNNGTMTVPNVKTSQPYNGNFLEFTVLDVTRAN